MDRRRFVLTSGALSLSLPILESFLSPAELRAQDALQKSFLIVFKCNSGHGDNLWPNSNQKFSANSFDNYATKALGPYASKILMARGYDHFETGNKSGCSHAFANSIMFTGGQWGGSSDGTYSTVKSIDVVIAQALHGASAEPYCFQASPFSEYKGSKLSWKGGGSEIQYERDPLKAYERINSKGGFPRASTGGAMTQAAPASNLMQVSVLDKLKLQVSALKGMNLSQADKERLERHFQSLRELEVKVATATASASAKTLNMDQKTEDGIRTVSKKAFQNYSMTDLTQIYFDMLAILVSTGQTRIGMMNLGMCMDKNMYEIDGKKLDYGHHTNTHVHNADKNEWTGGKEAGYEALRAHDRYTATLFAYLVKKLNDVDLGGGKTLLDAGTCLWTNDMSYGDHKQVDLPHIMAGSMGGVFKTGEMIKNANPIVNNRFLISLAAGLGVKDAGGGPIKEFNSAGKSERMNLIPELFAKVPT